MIFKEFKKERNLKDKRNLERKKKEIQTWRNRKKKANK